MRCVEDLLALERACGLTRMPTYTAFQSAVQACRQHFLSFVAETKRSKKSIAGYGAPAKGNTLLNYCGLDASSIGFTVDRNPHKQGHFLPGSHIPILAPQAVYSQKPDVVLILPWNLTDEIRTQMNGIKNWGGRFAVAIPRTTVFD